MLTDSSTTFDAGSLTALLNGVESHGSLTEAEQSPTYDLIFRCSLLCAVATSVWATCYFVIGALWPAVISLAMAVIWSATALHVFRSKQSVFAVYGLCYGLAVFAFGIMWSLGGLEASQGVIHWALVGPQLALAAGLRLRHGVVFLAATALLLLGFMITECVVGGDVLAPRQVAVPRPWQFIFAWMNVVAPGCLVLLIVAHLVRHSDQDKERLHEAMGVANRLNNMLVEEGQKLETEQRLAHKLITNVFPANISVDLLGHFRTYARNNASPGQSPRRKTISPTSARPLLEDLGNPLRSKSSGKSGKQQVRFPERPTEDSHGGSSSTETHRNSMNTDMGRTSSLRLCNSSVGRSEPACQTQDDGEQIDGVVDSYMSSFLGTVHPFTCILFADIVGFTEVASTKPAVEVVRYLDGLFSKFDLVCLATHVEKIKTIGDCYMCVAMRDDQDEAGAEAMACARVLHVATSMHAIIKRQQISGATLCMRAGMHCGSVVSGIIGKTKFCYDLWGDAVNVASRMESTGVPRHTQVSNQVYCLLQDQEEFTPRGKTFIKGKGELETYLHVPEEGNGDFEMTSEGESRGSRSSCTSNFPGGLPAGLTDVMDILRAPKMKLRRTRSRIVNSEGPAGVLPFGHSSSTVGSAVGPFRGIKAGRSGSGDQVRVPGSETLSDLRSGLQGLFRPLARRPSEAQPRAMGRRTAMGGSGLDVGEVFDSL